LQNDKSTSLGFEDEGFAGEDVEKSNSARKANVTEHVMSTSEVEAIKSRIGQYVSGNNYNQLIEGHGTGLRPPSEQEWNEIAKNSYSIDLVSYQGNLPLSVDESTKSWFPPIGNQGSQGSCVAWSIGYYVKTFQEAQEHNWDVSAARWIAGAPGYPTQSYQNKIISPAFIYNLQNGGEDNGLSFSRAINLICSVGVCSWEKMPYTQADYTSWPTELAWIEAPLNRGDSVGYQWIDLSTDQGLVNLKSWLASDHLVTIGVDGYKYSGLTSGDLWTLDNYINPSVNHANTIVGYDDSIAYIENGVLKYGAFKVANSWGVGGWERAPDGFLWISYEAMKQRVEYCLFYYDLIGYESTLAATFEISHAKRSECTIVIGMGNPNSPLATKSFSQYIDGGSFPFCQNNILLDITEFKNYVPNVYDQSYFLRVYDGDTSTTGVITSFAVEYAESSDTPCQTVNKKFVLLDLFLPAEDELTLTDVTMISAGTHYTTPAILLVGGGGTGATATAHVSNGVIYSIVITNPGSGYTSPPAVIIIDPNPRAQGATAIVNYASL
jgi:C1A family cysteine protease